MLELKDSKTEKVALIIQNTLQLQPKKILAVGCGSGLEAAILAQQLKASVIGIDVDNYFDPENTKYADLRIGDATSMDFEDQTFDFVYSYHSLEHIENPPKALSEIDRVLKKGGGYWVGTPNRSRLIGYIGSKDTTLNQKITYNIADWKARLAGKFRNELGAHAGFSASELYQLIHEVFPNVQNMGELYYSAIYENKQSLLKLINSSGLSGIIYPSVYFGGIK